MSKKGENDAEVCSDFEKADEVVVFSDLINRRA